LTVTGGLGLGVLITAVINAAVPTGDPGGRILAELEPTAAAVPGGANILYRQAVEPRWDSCDGRAGTFGWDDVVLVVHFASGLRPEAVAGNADATLRPLGWVPEYSHQDANGMAIGWTKTLSSGATAKAQLTDQDLDPTTWTLYVGAPPVGPRASGC